MSREDDSFGGSGGAEGGRESEGVIVAVGERVSSLLVVVNMVVMAHNTNIHAFSNTFGDQKSPALPSTLSLMANLLPTTLSSSPHMPALHPITPRPSLRCLANRDSHRGESTARLCCGVPRWLHI